MKSLGISLEEVKDQNEELLDQNNELLDCNKELKQEVTKVQCKLGIAVKDRAPLKTPQSGVSTHRPLAGVVPVDQKKQERFVLIKRNDEDYMP